MSNISVLVNKNMEAAQEALAPFIKSRDEAAHIRKVLGAHLNASLDGAASERVPLALVDLPAAVKIPPESRGLQREYLEALNANLKARQELEALKARHDSKSTIASAAAPDGVAVSFLADHLAALELQRKRQRLEAVTKRLAQLDQMPAASSEFLDPEIIFEGSPALPDVPSEAVTNFVLDKTLSKSSLDELLDRLQKSVLRAKLLLKKEEQLLDVLKKRRAAKSSGDAPITDNAKLAALTLTRNELIAWIEAELAHTSGTEGDIPAQSQNSAQQVAENRRRVEEQVSTIKEKYREYVTARKSLLKAASSTRQPVMEPPKSAASNTDSVMKLGPPRQASATSLLTPYLENLLAVSHEQKGLILQKSHLNTILAKQTKETCQILDHLAEESQLLPKYPMTGQARRQQGLMGDGALSGFEKPNVSSRAKTWIFAAEAAKLATLETVVEKTEEGEMALGASMQYLDEVDRLLGRQPPADTNEETGGDSDIWLQQGQTSPQQVRTRDQQQTDLWSILDGDLGLIGDEAAG